MTNSPKRVEHMDGWKTRQKRVENGSERAFVLMNGRPKSRQTGHTRREDRCDSDTHERHERCAFVDPMTASIRSNHGVHRTHSDISLRQRLRCLRVVQSSQFLGVANASCAPGFQIPNQSISLQQLARLVDRGCGFPNSSFF